MYSKCYYRAPNVQWDREHHLPFPGQSVPSNPYRPVQSQWRSSDDLKYEDRRCYRKTRSDMTKEGRHPSPAYQRTPYGPGEFPQQETYGTNRRNEYYPPN